MRRGEFQARRSDDLAKCDLELICEACGEVVCDVEDGDDLEVLVSVAEDHSAACRSKVRSS